MDWLRILGIDARLARYRRLAAEAAVAAEDRAELIAIEWQEEKERFARMVVLGVLASALAIVALTVFSMAVMVHFWDSGHRTQAAWCVAFAWLVIWAGLVATLVRTCRDGREAFALTRQELARDWAQLKERL
ncbi:MAG: phage holin family protein [Burkholderiaceae bacterium]|nr:phage holin family protein [Burkholderiaceae bacterium]